MRHDGDQNISLHIYHEVALLLKSRCMYQIQIAHRLQIVVTFE